MKSSTAIIIGLILGLISSLGFLFIKDQGKPRSFSQAVKKAGPSVVNIFTHKSNYNPQREQQNFFQKRIEKRLMKKKQLSLGSGIIVSPDGYIITSWHVIDDADEIQIMLHNGTEANANLVGFDLDTDIAVLKTNLSHLKPIIMGKTKDLLVGDQVLAIGNPFGFGQSVSAGIVSAKGRYGLNKDVYENYIQTDASINIGSSGGALVNINGDMVGMNTVIYAQTGHYSGIALATPVEIVNKVVDDIIQKGEVERGWLGIQISAIQSHQLIPNKPLQYQFIISQVFAGSPAARAGFKVGDQLISINHQAIEKIPRQLASISNKAAGDKLTIIVRQNQKRKELEVTLASLPQPKLRDRFLRPH